MLAHISNAKSIIFRICPEADFIKGDVANAEKFTTLGGKLFKTFTTRSLKSFSAYTCGSSLPTTVKVTLITLIT